MKTNAINFIKPELLIIAILIVYGCMPIEKPSDTLRNIKGVVRDSRGQKPIVGVKVRVGNYNPSESNSDGIYQINEVEITKSISIIAQKEGYEPFADSVRVSANANIDIDYTINMLPKRQISYSPDKVIKIDANDKARQVILTNIGTQGPLSVSVEYDPNVQWINVPQKGPIIISPNDNGKAFTIAVDSKGITTLGDKSTTVRFKYNATNTSYVDYDDYQVIMSVTSLPVIAIPAISNVAPLSGGYDTDVTISGQNFDTDTSKVQVLFEGSKKARIVSATPTELKVKVPVGAKTGNVRIITGQGQAVSNATFTYNLTCTLSTIATLGTGFYINDIITATDGTIFLCGFERLMNTNQILRSGVYRILPNNTRETPILEREAGFVNGSLSSTAKLINPTKLAAVNNDLYIADQYDASQYKADYTEGYASIRRIANGEITSTPKPYYLKLTNQGFIGDMVYIPGFNFNGLAFTDGAYKRYGFDGNLTEFTTYQGLNISLDFDGKDVYALDLKPANNPIQWQLHQLSATNLQDKDMTASGALGISSPGASPDNTNYPKGMVVDGTNRCAYIFDRKLIGTNGLAYIVYRVGLDDHKVEVIYSGNQVITDFENGKLLPDASKAKFASISCLTFDEARQAILLVDGKTVRAMECK